MTPSRLAALLPFALALHAGAADDIFEYAIPYSMGRHMVDLEIEPFARPQPYHTLTRVEITLEGRTITQLTTDEPFDGSVTVRFSHYAFADVAFGDGIQIFSFSPPPFRQNVNVSNSSSWFTTPFQASTVSLFSPDYEPGDPAFDRFRNADPIPLHLEVEARTDLEYPPTPDFIGRETGSEWTVYVKYTFTPAPGTLAIGGFALLFNRRRRH